MEPQVKPLTLSSFFNTLWRQRYAMAVIVFACLVAGYLMFKRAAPVWESSLQLMIEGTSSGTGQSSKDDPMQMAQNPIGMDVPSQIEVLKSDNILRPIYQQSGFPWTDNMSEAQRAQLPQISVDQVGETSIINIKVDSTNIEMAAQVAQTIPQVFKDYVSGIQDDQYKNAIDYLNKRLLDDQDAVTRAQKALTSFRKARTLQPVEGEAAYRSSRVTSTSASLFSAQTAVAAAQEKLDGLIKERAALPKTLQSDTKETNPEIDAEKQQIASLKVQREGLLVTKLPDSTDVKTLDAQIQAHEDRLRSLPKYKASSETSRYPEILALDSQIGQARIGLKTAQVEEQYAASEAAKAKKEYDEYNAIAPVENEYLQKLNDAEATVASTNRAIAALLVRKNSKADVVKIMQDPSAPSKVRPKGIQYMALALMMGIFLAAGFALTKDGLEDKFASSDEVYSLTGLNSLAEVPALPARTPVLASANLNEDILERYRVLRFNILYSTMNDPVRSLVVTSSGPEEGKTETACNLAIASAGEQRVILVDANLRSPSVHKRMNIGVRPGLTDVVAGAATLEECLHETEDVPGLRILTAGSTIATPAEMLASPQMRNLVGRLVSDSDLVIFDCASCIGFADSKVLSNVADSVLFVARSGRTKRAAVRKGIESLRQANARILGVATSGVGLKTLKS